jgi:hypothetical protein
MNPATGLTRFWQRAESFLAERYLGIQTRGNAAPPNADGVHYTPLPYSVIRRMLQRLQLRSQDVFVDVGCGKGRVVCCACRTPVGKVVALELNPTLLDEAMTNVGRVRGKRAPVERVLCSAEKYDYKDATVVYLYNPFHARLTELVLGRIHQSFLQGFRQLQIVYANPLYPKALMRHNWLEQYEEWPAEEFPSFGCRVSFWRAKLREPVAGSNTSSEA